MNIKTIKNEFKIFINKAWNHKIFRYGVLLQLSYYVIALIVTLIFFRNTNDFIVYYQVGETFISDITNLYNIDYKWPFRYFPISSLFFVPFYLLGFDLGFVAFNIINFLINILNGFLLYKIIIFVKGDNTESTNKRVFLYISIYLMGTPQLFNYILGQINLYIAFFILLSYYLFLTHDKILWEFLASFILGISVIFKPITLFIFPFLIILRYNKEKKKIELQFKKSLVRIIGALVPLSLNLIIFLIFPTLLSDFIYINLTGEETLLVNHSISLTKIISNLLYTLGLRGDVFLSIQLPIFITTFSLFFIISYGFFFNLQSKNLNRNNLLYGYILGILIMFISYFDTWNHHLIIIIPLLIIMILQSSLESLIIMKRIKKGLFFLNFFDIAFMGVFFITTPYFPFNFMGTIFLLILLYTMLFYCHKKESNEKSIDIPE